MYESPVILAPKSTEFGTFRVVAEPVTYSTHAPDYCGSDGFSETLLSWGGRYGGWDTSWTTCKGHGDTCTNSHPIDPDTIRFAANELDDSLLERWLNICAPDGIKYRVSRVHGYSQGDTWLLVESYPAHVDPATLPDPEHNDAVNWARGDVSTLVVERYEEDSDYWLDVYHGYHVYGQSWDLEKMDHVKDYAAECRDNYLSDLDQAVREKAARETDLMADMI